MASADLSNPLYKVAYERVMELKRKQEEAEKRKAERKAKPKSDAEQIKAFERQIAQSLGLKLKKDYSETEIKRERGRGSILNEGVFNYAIDNGYTHLYLHKGARSALTWLTITLKTNTQTYAVEGMSQTEYADLYTLHKEFCLPQKAVSVANTLGNTYFGKSGDKPTLKNPKLKRFLEIQGTDGKKPKADGLLARYTASAKNSVASKADKRSEPEPDDDGSDDDDEHSDAGTAVWSVEDDDQPPPPPAEAPKPVEKVKPRLKARKAPKSAGADE